MPHTNDGAPKPSSKGHSESVWYGGFFGKTCVHLPSTDASHRFPWMYFEKFWTTVFFASPVFSVNLPAKSEKDGRELDINHLTRAIATLFFFR
jgi:hypothetical protein